MVKHTTDNLTLSVAVRGDTCFDGDIVAYVFHRDDRFVAAVAVKDGSVTLPFSADEARARKVLFGPALERDVSPTLATLRRLSAFEAVLSPGQLVDHIVIPGTIVDRWPICLCWVTGRVLNHGRPVCNAQVHVCEVDATYWLLALPDHDLFRLRDDLIDVLRRPPKLPPPPRPLQPGPQFALDSDAVTLSRTLRERRARSRDSADNLPRPIESLPAATLANLSASSASAVRSELIQRISLFYPYLCLTPRWRRYHCDEVAVRTTDGDGRFSVLVPYLCAGDKPDIYVWVEFPIGGSNETIYRPPVACNTYWNYSCGSDITVNISDPRVPTCDPEPDLDGCVVNVLSIGRGVSVDDVQPDGLTTGGSPFGGTLEPRADFGRSDLIAKGITHYLWSYRRLTAADGTTPDVGLWQPLQRDVYRHYRVLSGSVLSYPSDRLGPDPAGPAANTFRIKPPAPPAPGIEWVTLNERIDLASAYFETRSLAGAPASRADGDDTAAGQYELKLELFRAGSATPIEWEPNGVALKVADLPAPFPTGTVSTIDAPEHRRIRNAAGRTVAFRLVLRIDNNFCQAEVFDASASAVNCGIIEAGSGATVELGFRARHPNGFASYAHSLVRGDGPGVPAAATSGTAGAADGAGYTQAPPFEYRRTFVASTLLGACPQAAFSEVIDVDAMATNGYSRLSGYDQTDVGAFALVTPCAPCDCDD